MVLFNQRSLQLSPCEYTWYSRLSLNSVPCEDGCKDLDVEPIVFYSFPVFPPGTQARIYEVLYMV